jgi:hypothetical protein
MANTPKSILFAGGASTEELLVKIGRQVDPSYPTGLWTALDQKLDSAMHLVIYARNRPQIAAVVLPNLHSITHSSIRQIKEGLVANKITAKLYQLCHEAPGFKEV